MKSSEIKNLQFDPLQQMIQRMSLSKMYKRSVTGATDFYKFTHPRQFNPEMDSMSRYAEPRIGGMYPFISYIGLQAIIRENLMVVPDLQTLRMMREWVKSAGGYDYFEYEVWDKVRKLGYIPLEIWGLPEGLEVPEGTPLFKFNSTEKWFDKSAGLLEDVLMHIWAPTTIATRTLNVKRSVYPYFEKTNCLPDLMYSILDFSPRSAVNKYESVIKGLAFLMFFSGSDNVLADQIGIMKHYYGKQTLKSVYATEHSTALSFGCKTDDEEEAYILHQCRTVPKDGIMSFVTDTRDTRNFLENVMSRPAVVAEIMQRTGTNVPRPDTGGTKEMIDMVCHYWGKLFGVEERNGYKILGQNGKALMGNNVNELTCADDYKYVTDLGWAASSVVEASGKGFFSWNMDRDTCRFAIKPNEGIVNGRMVNMAKFSNEPWKASKSGPFKVYRNDAGEIVTALLSQMTQHEFDQLPDLFVLIWKNGQFINEWTQSEIQANINSTFHSHPAHMPRFES